MNDESPVIESTDMYSLPEFYKPASYEFRVLGWLGQQSPAWFEGMEISVNETISPVQTIIRSYIEDQAALYGLISRIRDLGLTLISVNRIEHKEEDSDQTSFPKGDVH